MTDEQLAIWRRLTPEQRQRVIDVDWEPIANRYGMSWGYYEPQGPCYCPLGIAVPACGIGNPSGMDIALELSEDFDLEALDDEARGSVDTFSALYDRLLKVVAREAGAFIDSWDHGLIPPSALVARLRELQAA